MTTNGILDIGIQETVEDFRDPDLELSPEETMDIIKTLQVVGVDQEKYGEFTEEFKIWKQNNNGTFDMFLEERFQLPPGTITKIKSQQLVAEGSDDVLTEEDMTIQPGSGEMQDIMQSVGAPQRAGLGGRIGYQGGEMVLPEPRPEHDPRAGFFERMGAMPEQTLLRQAQPMRAPTGIMNQAAQAMGGEEGDIGMGGQPLGQYEHEGAEQPPSGFDRMQTGTYDGSLPHTPDIDMEMIIDFLKKMGMALTKENIAKAAQALGMALKFAPGLGTAGGLGIEGLRSLGAPEEVEETEEIGFQEGGDVYEPKTWDDLYQMYLTEGLNEADAAASATSTLDLDLSTLGKAHGGAVRQKYGLGSIVSSITGGAKKVLKSAKKILKSDIGKMAMLYVATAGASNYMAGAPQGWNWKKWLTPTALKGNLASTFGKGVTTAGGTEQVLSEQIRANALKKGVDPSAFWGLGEKVVNNPVAQPWYKGALPWIAGSALAGGAYTAANPGEEQFDMGKRDAEVDDITEWLAAIKPAAAIDWPYPDYAGAKGGRVGYANGGILDIEEVDLRDNGGFMPLGKKEKADDVPALLSKNEFVFTADAVKSAGEGDPEVGAERMQNVMKNLEAGGKISEESQGLEGAQDMFEISERLSEVV